MSKGIRIAAFGICSSLMMAGVGCNQDFTMDDLQEARQEVQEEREETAQTRADMQEEINEEIRETDEIRHEVARPNYDELNEEREETQEAREDANEAIQEEEQETREAEQEADKIEAKLNSQKSRDAYLKSAETELQRVGQRIEELKAEAENLEGPAKESTHTRIEELEVHQERLEEAIDEMKSVDPLKWETKRASVESAKNEVAEELQAQ